MGHEFPAVLAVITAFMGGIALGSFFFGRHPIRNDLQAYGFLELAIGVWALGTAWLIPRANRLSIAMLGAEPPPTFQWAVVFTLVFLTILPATMAMGASFPAVQRFAAAVSGRSNVGALYAANTAGAMLGALASAFWLMPHFGILDGTAALACLNLICGGVALGLARKRPALPEGAPQAGDWALAARLALTGFLGIAFETVMIRGLSLVLENTVFTFAAILATYLGATALGAALQSRAAWSRDVRWLALGLAASAVAGGLGLWQAPDLYWVLRETLGDSTWSVAAAEMLTAASVLALPALAMGITFASLAEKSLKRKPSLSWSVALNTGGAAFAPPLAGLLLLPAAGLNGSIAVIAAGYVLLAGKSRILLATIPVALTVLALPRGNQLLPLKPGERIAFYKEGAMAATAVIEDAAGERVLKVNHRFQMGGTAARVAEERHADIPLLLHPGPKRALFIGLGTGITFGAAANYPGLEAEGVELLPEVLEATRLFQEGERSLSEMGLKAHLADGRRFVASARTNYDVIVADLFHPAQDGAAFLYTREHFRAVREKLAEGGLFCQWLPVFQTDLPTLRTITRTFMEVFPKAEAWLLRFNVDTPVIGLLARQDSRPLSSDWVERRLGDSGLAAHLRKTGLGSSVRLLGCYIAGAERLGMFAGAGAINTDAHPVVMFEAPRLAFQKRDDPAGRLIALLQELNEERLSLPVDEPGLGRRVAAFIEARDSCLRGLRLEGEAKLSEAGERYLESARASADFTPAYAHGIALATAVSKTDAKLAAKILEGLDAAQPQVPVAGQLLKRLQGTKSP